MSFFKLLKNIVTDPNDPIAEETEGILSGNSMILDENTGKLYAKPNIPEVRFLPSVSERHKKSKEFLSGNSRTEIVSPSDPKDRMSEMSDTGNEGDLTPPVSSELAGSPEYQQTGEGNGQVNQQGNPPLSPILSALSEGQQTTSVAPSPLNQQGELIPPPGNSSPLPQIETLGGLETETPDQLPVSGSSFEQIMKLLPLAGLPVEKTATGSAGSTRTASKAVNETEGLPVPPELQRVPEESEAKNTKKWKDILVGILNNISKTDFNSLPPEQRTAAFLGAIAGGTAEGASTGRYAGKIANQRERQKAMAENQRRQAEYKQKLDLYGQRVNTQNAQLKPEFEQQKIDLALTKEENRKMRDASTLELKTRQAESVMQDRVNKAILADKKFEFLKGAGWQKVTRKMPDGSYQLMVINKAGQEIPVAATDGQTVKLADPTEVSRFLKSVEAEGDIAEAKAPVVSQDERRQMIEDEARTLAPNYDSLPDTAKAGKPSKALFRQRAAQNVDKRIAETNKRNAQKSRGRATKKAVTRPVRKSISNNLKGIDYSLSPERQKQIKMFRSRGRR